ncbi:MAG: hypothetical protein HKN74_07385, partial [Acidimicrobiia bacterium]|nr:hypothetical protein [Acidimicrobiia bacterium]
KGHVFIVNELGPDGAPLSEAEYDYWFGVDGDVPFVGDFDGDGIDELGLYRPGTGYVYMALEPPTSNDASTDLQFFYGANGDVIIAGDWDNDGIDTVGIYRASTGRFYLRNSNSTGEADQTIVAPAGLRPVAGAFVFGS